jgi:hypothetical protein
LQAGVQELQWWAPDLEQSFSSLRGQHCSTILNSPMSRCAQRILFLFAFFLSLRSTLAHQTSDSYLALQATNHLATGRWAIAIRDLNHVLNLDGDKDGEISDAELEKGKPEIESYVYNRLKISSNGRQAVLHHQSYEIQESDSAIFLVLLFNFELETHWPDLLIEYKLFFETDPLHRGLSRLDLPDRTETTIFSPSHPTHRFLLNQKSNHHFGTFLQEGVWHIWTGYDHILFLIALVLPCVLQRAPRSDWIPATSIRAAFLNTLKIVTAFTIAHSITLTLATLGWVRLPTRLTESVIAASVLLAALNNLKAIFPERTWVIAFSFGLIHGFGFATALSGLNLQAASLAIGLLGFNLGVELGQIAIILVFLPVAFSIRHTKLYQRTILRYGSILIALLSAIWLLERLTDKELL